jgi:hypothetical protein
MDAINTTTMNSKELSPAYIEKGYEGTSTSQGAKCAHLVSAYQGPLGNNSLYYIDFRQRNLHNL